MAARIGMSGVCGEDKAAGGAGIINGEAAAAALVSP
jgi:hypothetical protein